MYICCLTRPDFAICGTRSKEKRFCRPYENIHIFERAAFIYVFLLKAHKEKDHNVFKVSDLKTSSLRVHHIKINVNVNISKIYIFSKCSHTIIFLPCLRRSGEMQLFLEKNFSK